MYFAGIDAGSRTIKVVLIDDKRHIVASGVCSQGVKQTSLAQDLFQKVLSDASINRKDIFRIVATGYGRNVLDWADKTVTEITCQAYGVKYQVPDVRLIIDIGGEDSKVIRLDQKGVVHDFSMNDRCAAGTGRFLEMVANRLGVDTKNLCKIAQGADQPAVISSMCVVFAETEIIGLLASEVSTANIIEGVQNSIAKRIVSMVGQRFEGPVVFTGGVALLPGMRSAISKALKYDIKIAENPQITASFGAAVIALGDNNGINAGLNYSLEGIK